MIGQMHIQLSHIIEDIGHLGMLFSKGPLENIQCPLIMGLGSFVFAVINIEGSQIAQAG